MKILGVWDITANVFLWILIVIFILPVVLVLVVWKLVTIFLAKLVDSRLHATTPNDTYFAIDDTIGIPIVNAAHIWKVEGRIRAREFRQHFSACFLEEKDSKRRYLNFYCYLVKFGGYVFKKEVEVLNLEEQIYDVILPANVSVEEWITKWFLQDPFPQQTPLWRVALLQIPVSYYPGENCGTIVLYKNHHCLADGYGFIHIIDKLTGNESPYCVQEELESNLDKIKDLFMFPKALINYALDVASTKDIFYPIKRNDDRRWFISFATLDLKSLKEIRRKTKTHFITVMMSVMIGALRRLILENKFKDDIPENIYSANSLPWPKHPRTRLCNHWSGGVFKLPFRTADPLRRIREADHFYKQFHTTNMHKMVKRIIIPVTWCIPSFIMRFGHSLNLYYFRYSNTFASLMLSEKPYFLLGRRLMHIYLPLGLVDAVPTCVLFGVSASHAGIVDLSIVANSETVNDQTTANRLTQEYFVQEINTLLAKVRNLNSSNDHYVVTIEDESTKITL